MAGQGRAERSRTQRVGPDAFQAGERKERAHGSSQHDLARRNHAYGGDGAADRRHPPGAAVERGVGHAEQAAGEDRIAQSDGFQVADLVRARRPQPGENEVRRSGFHGQSDAGG